MCYTKYYFSNKWVYSGTWYKIHEAFIDETWGFTYEFQFFWYPQYLPQYLSGLRFGSGRFWGVLPLDREIALLQKLTRSRASAYFLSRWNGSWVSGWCCSHLTSLTANRALRGTGKYARVTAPWNDDARECRGGKDVISANAQRQEGLLSGNAMF